MAGCLEAWAWRLLLGKALGLLQVAIDTVGGRAERDRVAFGLRG
jgi:hypothetical protein